MHPIGMELPLLQGGNALTGLLPIIAIFVIFYFLLIRPQQKERKAQEAMRSALTKGQRVVTQGGVVADVVKVDEKEVTLQIDGARMSVAKEAIIRSLDDETKATPSKS